MEHWWISSIVFADISYILVSFDLLQYIRIYITLVIRLQCPTNVQLLHSLVSAKLCLKNHLGLRKARKSYFLHPSIPIEEKVYVIGRNSFASVKPKLLCRPLPYVAQ